MKKVTIKNKKGIKLLVATAMTIFSLVAVFTGVIAWFAAHNLVDGSGMSVQVQTTGNAFSSLTVHRCIINESSSTIYKFEEQPAISVDSQGHATVPTGEPNIFHIDDYSSLNRSQPVLLLLHLQEGTLASNVSISATTPTNYSDYADAGFLVNASTVNHFPFSFTSFFKSGSYTTSSFPFNNVVVSDLKQDSQFVVMNGDNFSSLNSDISMYSGGSDTVNGNGAIRYVAIVINYLDAAIQKLISVNMGSAYVKNNDNKIDYYCDWKLNISATIES